MNYNLPWNKPLDDIKPLARNNDPETSHEAAADVSFRASAHRLLALKTFDRYGALTDYELAARTGLQQNSIGKRRKDCQDAGMVERLFDADGNSIKRPAPSGSMALVWTLTEKGRNYLRELNAQA
jgi:DNA-binding MarR family transcriptional regulator